MLHKILPFFCLLWISLFAATEYDIISLSPQGNPIDDNWENFVCLNETGDVAGTINGAIPFACCQGKELKLVSFPKEYSNAIVWDLNNQGMVTGVLAKKPYPFSALGYGDGIFIYDLKSEEFYSFNRFKTSEGIEYALEDVMIDFLSFINESQVFSLTLSNTPLPFFMISTLKLPFLFHNMFIQQIKVDI